MQPGDPRLDPVADACRETGTVAVVGAAFHDQGDLYVSALVIDANGSLVTRYDKQHLFRSEREIYRRGEGGCTLQLDGWRLGLGICYRESFAVHRGSRRWWAKSGGGDAERRRIVPAELDSADPPWTVGNRC